MRLRPWQILLAFSAAYAVEIVPPSPYMSSPPPVLADTTVVDPGRKPKTVIVEPGTQELWYADWNLATDRPVSTEIVDTKAPRVGRKTFRAAFNDHGWPTEVSYFDTKANQKWTKLFRYPAKIPSGAGDVPFTATWISAKGSTINMAKLTEAFKAQTWRVNQRKYQVSDALGEPLVVESRDGGISGNAETWVYLIDGKEVRFYFDKDNQLTAVPGGEPPKDPNAKPAVAATPAPAKADTVKKSTPAPAAPAKSKKK